MAGSSETVSFADLSTSMGMLNVKPGHNLIHDLTSSLYKYTLQPMIECLCFTPLSQALTTAESIPLIHISKELSTTSYVLADDVINFEVASRKTSSTKARLCRMLGFGTSEGLVDPISISLVDLIHMFFQMGYNGELSLLSNFKKSNLPPIWNGLFTLLFKSFSECVFGSDNTSKLFITIIYGLYHDINLDYGSILWP